MGGQDSEHYRQFKARRAGAGGWVGGEGGGGLFVAQRHQSASAVRLSSASTHTHGCTHALHTRPARPCCTDVLLRGVQHLAQVGAPAAQPAAPHGGRLHPRHPVRPGEGHAQAAGGCWFGGEWGVAFRGCSVRGCRDMWSPAPLILPALPCPARLGPTTAAGEAAAGAAGRGGGAVDDAGAERQRHRAHAAGHGEGASVGAVLAVGLECHLSM